MRKTLLLLAMFVAFCSAQGFAADLVASTTLPTAGTPEHVFTIKSAKGTHMNGLTCPTNTYDKYGKFAFYAVEGKDNAYYIYSTTESKWITYEAADEYEGGKAFVTLGAEKVDACYFFASKTDDGAYDFAPATAGGDKADQYLNWFGGVGGQTPLNGTVTVGLWKDPARVDPGSKWVLTLEADEPNPNPVDGDFKVNFGKEIDPVNTDRKVTGFSVAGTETAEQTVAIESIKPYVNLMEGSSKTVITCKRSEELTVKFQFAGVWMNSYVYIDTNKDKQFSFKDGQTDQTGTELYAYSFYSGNFNDDNQGVNSKGESLTGNDRNVLNPPTFNAPAEPGDYAIRLKVDWNSVDAGGQIGKDGTCYGENGILANRGKIIDAILHVTDEVTSIAGVEKSNNKPVEYYDLSGRRLKGEPTHGVFIRKGAKTVKVVK